MIRLGEYNFDGPHRLSDWKPSGGEAVYAILHRPRALLEPTFYCVDYVGETINLAERGFPWRHHGAKCWAYRAGAAGNVCIATYYMPGSNQVIRRALQTTLIDLFDPACNR